MSRKLLNKLVGIFVLVIGLFMLATCCSICSSIIDIVKMHGSLLKIIGYLMVLMFLSIYGFLSSIGGISIIFGGDIDS